MIPFERIFQLLNEHEVHYVVIGGVAVVLHGYPRLTADLDLIIDLDSSNARETIRYCKAQASSQTFRLTFASLLMRQSDVNGWRARI